MRRSATVISTSRRCATHWTKIPAEMTEAKLDQLVKVWVEIADYNGMDGHLVVSHFRCYHGKDWTLRILRAILHEFDEPRIELHLSEPREVFVPFYQQLLDKHEHADDADFQADDDRSVLPL